MDVVRASLCFDNFYFLILTQLSQDTSDVYPKLSTYCLPSVFWCKDYMISAY